MKFCMDKTLRFWIDVAYNDIKLDHINLTKRQLVAQILHQYQERGDAMRHLDNRGKITWKASPRFLTMPPNAKLRMTWKTFRSGSGDRLEIPSNSLNRTMTDLAGMPSYFWLTSSLLRKPLQDGVPYTTQALSKISPGCEALP